VADLGTGDDLHLAATHPDPKRKLDVLATPNLENNLNLRKMVKVRIADNGSQKISRQIMKN
jgi:hypothetical protein